MGQITGHILGQLKGKVFGSNNEFQFRVRAQVEIFCAIYEGFNNLPAKND